jgi:hypothetical protein
MTEPRRGVIGIEEALTAPEERESVLRPDRLEVVVALLNVLESAVRYELMLEMVGNRVELENSLGASLAEVEARPVVERFGRCRGEAGSGLN